MEDEREWRIEGWEGDCERVEREVRGIGGWEGDRVREGGSGEVVGRREQGRKGKMGRRDGWRVGKEFLHLYVCGLYRFTTILHDPHL